MLVLGISSLIPKGCKDCNLKWTFNFNKPLKGDIFNVSIKTDVLPTTTNKKGNWNQSITFCFVAGAVPCGAMMRQLEPTTTNNKRQLIINQLPFIL